MHRITSLNGSTGNPPGTGRYSLVTIDRSQSPTTDDRGCFDSFHAAVKEARRLVGPSVDVAYIYCAKRGYAVAKIESDDG